MDQGIYQNSSNSTSTSTIPTLTDTIDSDNPEQVQGVEQKEEDIHQSENQIKNDHEDDPDKATIYVPDLSSDTTKKSLMTNHFRRTPVSWQSTSSSIGRNT